MLIRRFFTYFGDFWANFYDFLTTVSFYWLKWLMRRCLLLEQVLNNNWVQFCGCEKFFCWTEIGQKMAKIGTIFLNFLQFSVLFCFLGKFLTLL